jgi:lycopene beta-cyclase
VRQPDNAAADLVLVGGGLANALVALRLHDRRPDLRVLLVEREASLGGNHTWSCFATDLPAAAAWIDPLVVHRWPGYQVRFPGLERRLGTPYCSLTSDRLHATLVDRLGAAVRLASPVAAVSPSEVTLATGETIRASAVLDGRGAADTRALVLGFQKFLGLEIRLDAPHRLDVPIVMDADVGQLEGYRFLYVLPLGERRLLVEDTRYSDDPTLDRSALRAGVAQYLASRGWRAGTWVRQESGVLPIALGGDIEAFWTGAAVGRTGLAAALFHPTTGYSLPDAVRLADEIAALDRLDSATLLAVTRARSQQAWRSRGYFRLLNRMLFRAGPPAERYRVLERFYALPQPLIERFYAARPTLGDRVRMLAGRPPVPLVPALSCLSERRFTRRVGTPA